MELVGIYKMKKAPLAKNQPASANWWGDINTGDGTGSGN